MQALLDRFCLPILVAAGRLGGPIFDRELRVTSRRLRYYILRSSYVGLLILFLVFSWGIRYMFGFGPAKSAAYKAATMPMIGQAVTMTVLWLQFLCSQLLACVMLSAGISDEIRARTLDVLLTTNVNCVQIVIGKLVSRLLQMLLLIGVSLPLLAILRVLGGVQWTTVIAGICITATSALFIGSLSLLLSIYLAQGYRVVVAAVLLCSLLFGGIPILVEVLEQVDWLSTGVSETIVMLTNPFYAMICVTDTSPAVTGVGPVSWVWHCVVMVAASAIVSLLTMHAVRRSALSGSGSTVKAISRGFYSMMDRLNDTGREASNEEIGAIIRVKGSPILWREMQTRFMRYRMGRIIVYSIVGVLLLGVLVAMLFLEEAGASACMAVAGVLSLLVLIRIAAGSASCITREKEARTWPVLLSTPIYDGDIIRDKALAAVLRNLPTLILLVATYGLSMLYMTREEPSSFLMLLAVLMGLGGSAVFVIGLGMFFSTTVKSTTAAVVATIAVYFGASYFSCACSAPILGFLTMGFSDISGDAVGVIMTVMMQLVPAALWTVIGIVFIRLAVGRIRRNVF